MTWGWINDDTVFILTKIWLVKAYYSAANKDKLLDWRGVWIIVCVCVFYVTRSQRGRLYLAVFQVVKMMGEENTCSSPPSVPSLSLCSLERCHLIKPQVLQTGKRKPEVWRNVNELWWEISHCRTECMLWWVSACYYKCYLSAVTTFD